MTINLLEKTIFYGRGVQRYTQDSPIMPDVWMKYGESPRKRVDLLLNPYKNESPGILSRILVKRLPNPRRVSEQDLHDPDMDPKYRGRRIAYNLSNVAARLYFDELIKIVLPMTSWWNTYVLANGGEALAEFINNQACKDSIVQYLHRYPIGAKAQDYGSEQLRPPKNKTKIIVPSYLIWLVRVVGAIELARERNSADVNFTEDAEPIVEAAWKLFKNHKPLADEDSRQEPQISPDEKGSLVWSVTLNRPAQTSVWMSVPAVKADAARLLFDINCKHLCWAIIDSGIDATHPAFQSHSSEVLAPTDGIQNRAGGKSLQVREAGKESKSEPEAERPWRETTRVVATYDFTIIRELLSPDREAFERLPSALKTYFRKNKGKRKELKDRLAQGRTIDWDLLLPYLEVSHSSKSELKKAPKSDGQGSGKKGFTRPYVVPKYNHGTHVAGILAADWGKEDKANKSKVDLKGICPDIRLYDLRVLDEDGMGNEFEVIAAMQFVRHLNANKETMVIHGANLSLCIYHNVRNYACGCTPVCEECERMVNAGVVVVAAAGNEGYYLQSGEVNSEGYRSISITDPGNTEAVITVGATHRDRAHTYGVSFFSSRGPTGDGRLKPDLVAPGEKITSVIPGRDVDTMDGTSMAAPHVSGAAALLLARYQELIGRPMRVKQILCNTATDLGRERYFQGNGMVDVLRAMQSI